MKKLDRIARPYIIANAELTKLPRIGPGGPGSINKEPDLEAVLNVKPDVIFISYMEPRNADELQKKLGIPVVILTHGRFASFDELVYGSLRVAGKILNKEKRAEEVIDFVENKRLDLATRSKGFDDSQKPSVYVGGVGYKGVQGIESSDASFTPIEWVGARNIAKEVSKGEHLFLDKEKLLSLNPSIIFIDGGGLNLVKQDFEKRPEFYKGLGAFKDNKVYALYPFNYYTTNVDTAIVDAYTVGKVLYPENFSDVSLPDKADEIYKFLVGKPVYKEMEKDLALRKFSEKDIFPAGFFPLPHPNHPEGGMLFPKKHIDEIKKQEQRDLTRFDLDFDLPEHLLPEFPAAIYLTTRPDLGDVSQGKLVTIENYFEMFNGILNPKQLEGLRLLVTPFPQQQFNQTDDRRSERPSRGVTCFDCHANGHTNGGTHLVGDIRPQEFRHRPGYSYTERGQHPAAVRIAASVEDFGPLGRVVNLGL